MKCKDSKFEVPLCSKPMRTDDYMVCFNIMAYIYIYWIIMYMVFKIWIQPKKKESRIGAFFTYKPIGDKLESIIPEDEKVRFLIMNLNL